MKSDGKAWTSSQRGKKRSSRLKGETARTTWDSVTLGLIRTKAIESVLRIGAKPPILLQAGLAGRCSCPGDSRQPNVNNRRGSSAPRVRRLQPGYQRSQAYLTLPLHSHLLFHPRFHSRSSVCLTLTSLSLFPPVVDGMSALLAFLCTCMI
jgi:hypothetical protein